MIAEDPAQSSIEVALETASVSTNNEMRDKDLQSPIFKVFLPAAEGFIP
jgi:polyisoprenoid-binding protein YceI